MNAEEPDRPRGVEARLTKRLAQHFCPVPSYFLRNYRKLTPGPGAKAMTPTTAMVIVQLLDNKHGPRPISISISELSKRVGIGPRGIRHTLKWLRDAEFVYTEPAASGGHNLFFLEGLFIALEALMDQEIEENEEKQVQAAEREAAAKQKAREAYERRVPPRLPTPRLPKQGALEAPRPSKAVPPNPTLPPATLSPPKPPTITNKKAATKTPAKPLPTKEASNKRAH